MNTLSICTCPDRLCADGRKLWETWLAAQEKAANCTSANQEYAQRLHWQAAAAYAAYAGHVRNARRARAYNASVELERARASGDAAAIARAEAAYADARAAIEETVTPR